MNKPDAHPAIHDCYLDHPYALAGRVIDPVSGNVSWQGKLVHLQRKDLEVLAVLASVTGSVVSRAGFIAVVWDGNDLVGANAGCSNTIGCTAAPLGLKRLTISRGINNACLK